MIEVLGVRVGGYSMDYLAVSWSIVPTMEDLRDYVFVVERSESVGGPFVPVSPDLVDRYIFRDTSIPARSAFRRFHYRIRTAHVRTGENAHSAPATRTGDLPLDAVRMVELQQMHWQRVAGQAFLVYPARTFGQRCPQCYDGFTRRKTDSKCRVCYATGFSGGYHHPMLFWGELDSPAETDQVTVTTHLHTRNARIRMGPDPDMHPGDLVVTGDAVRYTVSGTSSPTRLARATLQNVDLIGVPLGAIQYDVPVRIDDFEDLRPKEPFMNRTCIDGNEDIAATLEVYRVR
ncbi:hypothetical protein EBT31_07645 [bacterium]|nr:hypothetical protein [bacterium]